MFDLKLFSIQNVEFFPDKDHGNVSIPSFIPTTSTSITFQKY